MAQDSKQIANLAGAFSVAAERCREPRPLPGGAVQLPIAAAVVCAAFSIELSLKSILAGEGTSARGHKLDGLFAQLSASARSKIVASLKMDEGSIQPKLVEVADAFVEWRYVYEQSSAHVDLSFLFGLANACRSTSLELVA